MTREELHEQVGSQPIRVLAKSMGISDVALAKRCRAASVPVPPRGWWARREAGKQVKVEPLPPLPFAMANYFPAIHQSPSERGTGASSKGDIDGNAPDPPVFRDLAAVSEEIRSAVRAIKVPSDLATPHPIVARLLQQDAKRKPRASASSYFSDRHGPKFATSIQQRRLRILSSIFTELERLGCKARGSTHAGERFSIIIGGYWTHIFFGIEGGSSGSAFYTDRRTYPPADRERLRFDLIGHDERIAPKRSWREDKAPLERQATEIVRGLLVQAEEDTREWALTRYKWDCEDRQRKIREARLADEKAEADRVAREKEAAAARIEALLSGADTLEQAARIRRYVAAIRAASCEGLTSLPSESVENWARWALAEADRIDPVVSGRFASDVEP